MMGRIENLISLLNFGMAILAGILLIFSQYITVPEWMSIAGRLHPVLLHLPIGMFGFYVMLYVFRNNLVKSEFEKISGLLLSLCSMVSFGSAIAGVLLSHETGEYQLSELAIHKNTGFAFSFGVYLLYLTQSVNQVLTQALIVINSVLIIIAGHKGAEITHGKNFLFPDEVKNEVNIDSNSSVFTMVVVPILEKKCYSCHNNEKSKGDLILTDTISFLKGGESGKIIYPGNPDSSKFIYSLLLPIEDESHMPPQGKPQLSAKEIETLSAWVQSGADFNKKMSDYTESEPIYNIAKASQKNRLVAVKNYTFSQADKTVVLGLNSPFMSVKPVYHGSPALEVSVFLAAEYNTKHLNDLLKVKEQIVHLNLADLPVSDDDLDIVAKFSHLEKLVLNGTKVTDDGVLKLKNCTFLENLALTKTAVSEKSEPVISGLKKLKNVYLNDSKIDPNTLKNWQTLYPSISFYMVEELNEKIKLSPPLLVNENTVIPVNEEVSLRHYIKDVVIKYTLDGSAPDSSSSPVFDKPVFIKGSADLKAIAIKDGWLNSDVITYSLFEKGMPPDSCTMLSTPNQQYLGLGNLTFTNGDRGPVSNLKDQNWIAFRDVPFSAIFDYGKPKLVQKISFCYGLQVPAYVFPPTSVKIYGGNDVKIMKLISQKKLPLFDPKDKDQIKPEVIHFVLSGQPFRYYKIEAQNLPVIPKWHPGKGEKGWLFIDEIFFYQ